MHPALGAVLGGRPVPLPTWASFWDALAEDTLDTREPAVLLAALAPGAAHPDTFTTLVRSLHERRTEEPVAFPGAVNVVGTGGGPPTFNVSTAAALVAAATGVPVLKTGSRAYTSSWGSVDLLERVGIPQAGDDDEADDMIAEFGIAFAGPWVYPAELTTLARRTFPLPMRAFGHVLNLIGPFLPTLHGTTQLTGVSDPAALPHALRLAAAAEERTIWLVTNELGADEMLGFTRNVVHRGVAAEPLELGREELGTSAGTIHQLAPVTEPARLVVHFLDVVAGRAGEVVTDTVALNAAALAVASGRSDSWRHAVATAREAIRAGAVVELVERLRAHAATLPKGAPAADATAPRPGAGAAAGAALSGATADG